jgi:ferredoxin, 2Fe-2S
MPRITYVSSSGAPRTVDVPSGLSVMEGAIRNDVPGIIAECGGACSCATCHVYVAQEWRDLVGPQGQLEQSMLEYASGVAPNSRLSCQIRVTDALDGLVLTIPENQG